MKHQVIFNLAMDLMDERLSNGTIPAADTAEYKAKAPGLLTILQTELCRAEAVTPAVVSNLEDTVLVSDTVALAVLPYGLAAHLLIDENPDAASFFQQRYEESKRRVPGRAAPTVDAYSLSDSDGW